MKIIHFSTFDTQGGAGNAAYQLHKSLRSKRLDSTMLVRYKKSDDDSVMAVGNPLLKSRFFQNLKRNSLTYYIFGKINILLQKINKNYSSAKFNKGKTESFSRIKKHLKDANIICIHWIDNFISAQTIKKIQEYSKAPIVWILQDIEPLTGGCHYTDGCEQYKFSCGNCPQLGNHLENDSSRQIWKDKKQYLGKLNITFIAPTFWAHNRMKESSLFGNFPAEKILLPLDDGIFNQKNKGKSRLNLDIPKDAHVIFFGAQSFQEKRKGMYYLQEAFDYLYLKIKKSCPENLDKILLLSAGRDIMKISQHFKQIRLGWISNQKKLAEAYKSADVFACPSVEDAGPIMINQSIACGTPVVSFNMGVAQDLIINSDFGYITENFDSEKFAENLYKTLFERNTKINMTPYDSNSITKQYVELFNKLLKK
jgi:glycosyltransferase involved in cell wall biosynthesis